MMNALSLVAPFLLALSPVSSGASQDAVDAAWPTWRGPGGNGAAAPGTPPLEWSEDKNVRWKVDLPGLGSSTPIVWGDRLYVTTAIKTEEDGETAPAGEAEGGDEERERGRGGRRGRGGWGRSAPPTKIHEFAVLCLDRADGKILWSTTVAKTVPHEGGHATASQASGSPLTDGEHIYVSFGSRGVHCLELDGKLRWSRDFGLMRTRNGFGEGSSPALYDDTLVVNWDHEGDSFIVALDKNTGEERWRRKRDEATSWATPLIVPVDGKPQVIIPASASSIAYDLKTGETVWTCPGMVSNCIPSPLYSEGVVYLMSGYRGAALQAIRLAGAKGDLSESENLLWTHGRNTSYTPSGVLHDGLIYFLRGNSGVLSCVDAASGDVLYEGQKLESLRTVYSSPVVVNERVYITSREGTTMVVAHGMDFEVLATNQLDDGFDASAVAVGNELYLRGKESLYCLAEEK